MCTGAWVCWFSGTHKCETLSITKAEYVALADTIKEVMFLRYVWSNILPRLLHASRFYKGARHLANNPVCALNSKHIDIIRHHFLRELVFRGEF